MSWQVQEKEAMQKFLRESILQLCRINIGIPGSYEVDGIICITRGSRGSVDGNTDEDQIVVKVHEQITANIHENVCPPHPHSSILSEYLTGRDVPSRLIRNPPSVNPPLNLKRKANDENDNAIIDSSCNDCDNIFVPGVKLLRSSDAKLYCGDVESDDQAQTRRPALHARVAASSANSETVQSQPESYSCGSCLLDFDSWVSLQGHFQQSHASCLEHYCRTCAVGFLSAADLGKHNSSVHKRQSSTAVVVSRRKQYKPRRGVANDEASVLGDFTEDVTELSEYVLNAGGSKCTSGDVRQNDIIKSSLQPLLQKRPLSKMVNTVKQEQSDDTIANAVSSEIVSEHICPHCTSLFTDFSTFSIHCRAVHHRYPCPYCVQTFTQRVNRDRHLYRHTGKKPYECATCGDGFKRRDALRKHQLKHNYNADIAENVCSERDANGTVPFSDDDSEPDADTIDEHGLDLSMPSSCSRMSKDSKESKIGFEENNVLGVVSEPKSFMHPHLSNAAVRRSPVPVASSEWKDIETPARFQSTDPTDRAGAPLLTGQPTHPPTEGRWYNCDICRASIIGAAAFELHCRSEHRRTPCVYCGKTFSQKGNMERHQRQHTGERPFACPHCSCSYTRKETLKVHINQAHPAAVMSDPAAGHKETSAESQSAAVSDITAGQ